MSNKTGLTANGLAEKSVVVVGATGALGSATAIRLADMGAKVTMAGANLAKLQELESGIVAQGGVAHSVNLRPESEENSSEIIAQAVEHFGGVDGLVVASGSNYVAPIVDMTPEQFDSVMNANVRNTWLICRAFGKELLKNGATGSAVIVTSTRAHLGHGAGYTAYCSSKGAENLLTRTLAAEWGPAGIRVNAVAPTVFRSELTAWMYGDDERAVKTREGMLSRIPLGRLAEADDVVGPIVFLLSEPARFCTGQILYVDGGYTAC
jgi:NAD(P)-dependent dehydrogenase (short-subunit alcohol dehydrogenase family)